MTITVLDSFMGSGKSTWAFQYMREHPENRYVYIAPFLSECERVQEECPQLHFCQPLDRPSKQANFKRLAHEGRNIATTHALLSQLVFEEGEFENIQRQHYTFILDEVVETVEVFSKLTRDDYNALERSGWIRVKKDGNVEATSEAPTGATRFQEALEFIRAGSVFRFENCCLVWTLPVSTLHLADHLYVLTFLFEASHLKHTMDMHHLEYTVCHLQDNQLVPGPENLAEKKQWIREHIKICDGQRFNGVGDTEHALSANKWKKYSMPEKQNIANKIRNYFSYGACHERIPSGQCMWTVYGETVENTGRNRFSVKDYDLSWVAFNSKAVNQYRDRFCLAYPVNVYEHVQIKKWFEAQGEVLDNNLFALSTMLQWIWRSAIRNQQYIYLYLPSVRMRNILISWLNH